jgi:hypothetical protein
MIGLTAQYKTAQIPARIGQEGRSDRGAMSYNQERAGIITEVVIADKGHHDNNTSNSG